MVEVFYNYRPSKKTETLINKEINKIRNHAPYNSYVWCCMEKREQKYKFIININSSSGGFNGSGDQNSESLALNQAVENIQQQLIKWHKKRFNN